MDCTTTACRMLLLATTQMQSLIAEHIFKLKVPIFHLQLEFPSVSTFYWLVGVFLLKAVLERIDTYYATHTVFWTPFLGACFTLCSVA